MGPRAQGISVGEVSDANPTDITPASYAFSIWGAIYTLLALFCVLSHPKLSSGSALLTERIGWLFVATNVANAAWICTFVWGSAPAVWVSTVFIAALEACLIAIYLRANCWREKRASLLEFVAVDVAFSAYLGWVTVSSHDLWFRTFGKT